MAINTIRSRAPKDWKEAERQKQAAAKANGPKNNGGFLGGAKFIGQSVLAGIGGIAEGIYDILGARNSLITGDEGSASDWARNIWSVSGMGGAVLGAYEGVKAVKNIINGNTDAAKAYFKDDVVGDWYEDVRADYNPGGAMSFIGDVAHGLGQSAYLFIPAAGAPLFYTGIISQGVSSAAKKTGDVGIKELAYGAIGGATEAIIDKALGGTTTAITNAVKGVGKGATKASGRAIFKATTDATRKGLARTVLSSAAGEFGEEFISELSDTFWQRRLGIDPNAQYSLKDAIRAGAVGAVSGATSTSVATVPRSINFHNKGESIIKRGNSQTLVNTATRVADRLAAKGTVFKDAAEWVTALRGQVDAYNDLVKKGKGESASAKTILGEMQAYLYFAETKAAHAGITERIKNASEEDRAALAEYINMTVKESDRPRTYTAEDVANNTDEIASQLAIMEFAGVALNYDAIRSDAEYEQEIASVIADERNEGVEDGQSVASVPTNDGAEMSPEFAAAAARAETVAPAVAQTVDKTVAEAPQRKMLKVDRKGGNVTRVEDITTNESLRQDAKDIETGAVEIDDDAERIKGDVKRAVGKITVDGAIYELSEKHLDEISRGVQKYLRQGMSEEEAITRAVNERLVDIKELGESGRITHQVGKNHLAKIKGAIINEYKRELQGRAKKGAEAATTPSTADAVPLPRQGGKSEERVEAVEKSSEREEKASESADKSTEGKNDAPKISEAKESLTDEQRKERARKRAERIIEWGKENAPSVKELNRARSYVKGFDNLSPERRQSIIRMLRSAEGIDEKTVKGIANLMAIKAGADLEIRFDDKVSEYGLTATIGDKTLILVSSKADFKKTVKGTVAHELVHYLENKPGYKTFAEYVMKRVKPEKKAEIEKDVTERYNEHYKVEYRSELEKQGLKGEKLDIAVAEKLASAEHKAMIDSEVTAELVGQALNNDKFLSRYARIGNTDGFIKKAWSFLRSMVKELKSKGEENNELADIIMPTIRSMDRLLRMENVGESKSEKKYLFAGDKAKTADKMKLATAKKMLESGADSETVRRETGWFKGYDGKWKFEINDLQMDVSTAGKYTRDPEIKRYLDLMNKAYFEMTATQEELSELKKLDTSIGDRSIAPGTLGDLIYHPALFQAYPELENVKIRFEEGLNDTRGVFNPEFNEIVLSKSLKTNPKQLKKTLIHEIQHAVQHIEEFAKGSSPEYWVKVRNEAIENVSGARANLDLWLEDIGYPQFAKESMSRVVAKEITLSEHWKALEDFKKNSKYARQIANSEREVAEYERRLSELNSLGDGKWATPKEMYFATAGEVEARDAAERSDLTEEQRKNTRPDVDREDVVFADKSSVSYFAANNKNAENESTKEQLRNHLDEVNAMEPVANVRYQVVNKQKAKQDTKDFYKSKGYKLDRQNFGIIEMGESEVELSSNYANTAAEFAAWMTVPNVLKRGKLISGHNDHKGEGFPTYTFAAPVVINGQRGNVAVVVRKTGKYRYKMHRILMPDGSVFVYKDINENAELTGSDILLNEKEKGPDISSASTNSIPQKSDLSTPSTKKYSLAPKKSQTNAKEAGKKVDAAKAEEKQSARKSATVVGEYSKRFEKSFDLDKVASEKIAAELEGIENAFVKGDEEYADVFRRRVGNIAGVIVENANFEIASDYDVLSDFSRYMVRKRFRVDSRFRSEMGNEWKDIYKSLKGRIASDKNTQYSHIDIFYSELSDRFPGLFSDEINNIHDQLLQIASVLSETKDLKKASVKYAQLPSEMQSAVMADVINMSTSYVTRIESNRDVIKKLRDEVTDLDRTLKKERGMRERMARERAESAKVEGAQVFAKKDVEIAVKSIEGWTQEEVLSLAKGQELQGMTRAKREEMISQIYVALHEEGAKGRVGAGYVAVKALATKIASDYLDSAQIKGEDGKSVHLSDIYDESSINGFKQDLTNLLFGEFAHMGRATQNAEFQAIIRAQNEAFSQEQLSGARAGKEARNLAYQGKKLRELVETQKRDGAAEDISLVTKQLSAVVDVKGNIRVNAVDKAMGEAARFFEGERMKAESERNMLKTEDGKDSYSLSDFAWVVNDEMKFMIDEYLRLRKGREGKGLSAEEMRLAADVLRAMKTTIERYNKEYVNGHWVDAEAAAKDCVAELTADWRDKEYKNKVTKTLGGAVDWIQEKYFYKILTPETVVETLEGFSKNGLLKRLYHSIRVHKQKAEHLAVQMKKPLAEFLDSKENKYTDDKGIKHSFRTKLNKKMISVDGANGVVDLTLGEAIYLYMLTKREPAHAGLREEGYIVYDDKNQKRAKLRLTDIEVTRNNIYNQLDATDIEFLKMAESFFNETASKIKYDADMNIFGYTNIQDGYYVPMIRDRYGRMHGVTDARQSIGSIVTVYNKSFNQNLVENAKALEGKNIMSIINDHADGLADYTELYLPLKAFDRIYNKAVATNDGSIRSIREVLNNEVWNGTEKYFKDLFADIQGQREHRDDVVNNIVGKLRSGWVNSVLGANLKVVTTQTTSLVSATQVIGAKYIAKSSYLASPGKLPGLDEIRERAYKYSDIIEARSFDMGALKAQGNIDKVSALGEKAGWAIGWMDERICLAVFHAAELQVQDQKGYAVGSEENARLAGKLADEAIYTTQAMSSASERSALQRSESEIGKMFAMFTSDTVKNLSHLYGNIMKWNAYRMRNNASDGAYEAEMKQAGKDVRKSLRTLAATGLMLGLITQGFKYLYGREEEDPEDKQKDLIADVAGSTLNILPIASDVIDKIVFDYDMSINVLDVVNDTLDSLGGTFKMVGKSMSGEYVPENEIIEKSTGVFKSVASVFGLPVSPLERTVTGLIRFVPGGEKLAYGYNDIFGNPSYTADLKKAVESGDGELAEYVLEKLYESEISGVYTSEELEEVVRLYSLTDESGKHYNVLPQRIPEKLDDDTKMNAAQRKQFEKIYSQSSAKVNELIRSDYYAALDDRAKAKAISNTYGLYFDSAKAQVMGKDWSVNVAYSHLTGNVTALMASKAYKSGLEEHKDERGRTVTVKEQFAEYLKGLDLSKEDQLIIAYANGYKGKATTKSVLKYINSLGLSGDVLEQIAKALNLDVKDGAVVEKKE